VPGLTGQGHGRWLLSEALRLAWRKDVRRVVVNTNSNDHPAALRSYLRQGFRPYGRAIGTLKDPRLQGLYPREAAPHLPIIEHPRRV
jgi:GNAT superfamily N-acetyltransferase